MKLLGQDIYSIITEEFCGGRTAVQTAVELISAEVKIIQYREKDKSNKEKYNDCLEIRALTQYAGVTFIVNDDIDIALAVKADGVHIGQDDMPFPEVRKLCGSKMLIGLSTHSPSQAQEAAGFGADYIGVGPIFPTKTKKNVCDAVGLEYLEYALKNIERPLVAIGGIKLNNIGLVAAKGPATVCLVTEITGSSDIKAKVAGVRAFLK